MRTRPAFTLLTPPGAPPAVQARSYSSLLGAENEHPPISLNHPFWFKTLNFGELHTPFLRLFPSLLCCPGGLCSGASLEPKGVSDTAHQPCGGASGCRHPFTPCFGLRAAGEAWLPRRDLTFTYPSLTPTRDLASARPALELADPCPSRPPFSRDSVKCLTTAGLAFPHGGAHGN